MEIDKLPVLETQQKGAVELVQKQKQEYHMIGRMRVVSGHRLFSFNRKTGEIKEADTKNYAVMNIDGSSTLKKEVQIDKDCFYEQALNKKNFIKRLKRYGFIE